MKLCSSPLCSGGLVFDDKAKKMVTCPLCAELRQDAVLRGVSTEEAVVSLSEQLGFRRVFSRLVFDLKQVIGSTFEDISAQSRKDLQTTIEGLVTSVSSGNIPKTSFLVYLGSQADVELLGYLILGSAYKAGLVAHPFVTPFRLQKIKRSLEDYENLLKSDVVVVTCSPSLREDGYLIEDLVRQRAYEGKATYVILSDGVGLNGLITRLCSDNGISARQCLYVGIPNLSADEVTRTKRVNSAIRNSNKVLGISIPEVELEEKVASGRPVVTGRFSSEADIFGS